MADEMETAAVIDFAEASKGIQRGEDFPPLSFKRDTYKDCQHKKRQVNGTLRRIECRLCGD